MATTVIMPRQGQSVETCIINEWYKKKGDKVNVGDVLFSYETDKAAFEVEAEEAGELLEIFYDEDSEVPVLTNVAVIGEPGESVEEFRPDKEEGGVSSDSGEAAPDSAVPSPEEGSKSESTGGRDATQAKPVMPAEERTAEESGGNGNVVPINSDRSGGVSPRAAKLAEQKKVPVSSVTGSGPGGRITARDVEEKAKTTRLTSGAMQRVERESLAVPESGSGLAGRVKADDLMPAQAEQEEKGEEVKKLSNIRKTIARRMHSSLQNTAQLTLNASADARRLKSLRQRVKQRAKEGFPNLTINDMVCFALIKTLRRNPAVNAHFLDDRIKYFGSNVHLGLAVDTKRGLMVPTIHKADKLNIAGLSEKIRELAKACREGAIDLELLEGATFTVTNLGAFGIESFTPILNPPQVAILGVNTITYQAASLDDGAFAFVPRIGLSLTFDHRAVDGAPAAAFLQEICREIKNLEFGL